MSKKISTVLRVRITNACLALYPNDVPTKEVLRPVVQMLAHTLNYDKSKSLLLSDIRDAFLRRKDNHG